MFEAAIFDRPVAPVRTSEAPCAKMLAKTSKSSDRSHVCRLDQRRRPPIGVSSVMTDNDSATQCDLKLHRDSSTSASHRVVRDNGSDRQPASVRLRAICVIHSPFGSGTMPAISTRRVDNSMTNRTENMAAKL